jgi:beta-fructofuranosidase
MLPRQSRCSASSALPVTPPFPLFSFVACLLALTHPALVFSSRAQTTNLPSASTSALWPESLAHQRLIAAAEQSVVVAAARVAQDRFRPAFHFLPAGRFMNDPNGCVQFQGAYHLFFQHLPFWGEPGASGAPGWGHAVTRDLVHWQHCPIALMPVPGSYDSEAVASGACVIDDGWPTIVYTSVPPQAQSLARSFDGMRTWRRFAHNPVIPKPPPMPALNDGFRDPFIWREGSHWRLLAGSGLKAQGGTVLLYESPDLIAWTFLGPLCTGMGPDCFQWECPNFFPLGDRWVLVVSPLLHSIPSLRGAVQYAVGSYDGRHFTPGAWHPLDLGGPSIFYAPNSLQDDQGRRILWGWIMGGGEPGAPWNGLLTLPRQLDLGPDQQLHVRPVDNVAALRAGSCADLVDQKLNPGESLLVGHGTQLDVLLEFASASSGRLRIDLLRSPSGEHTTTIRFDFASRELRCGDKTGIVPPTDQPLCQFRLLIDRSVVELYADQRAVMTLRAYPPAGADELRLTAETSPLHLARARAWRMNSIW